MIAAGSYWCCLITRDGIATVGRTLDSLFAQTAPPAFTVIVDDGSSEPTREVLEQVRKNHGGVSVIRTGSKTRDIRRVPYLLNLGIDEAHRLVGGSELPTYMMISGDDNWLGPSYASSIIGRMDARPVIAVASGSWLSGAGRTNQIPHGGGRFVRTSFMNKVGGRYPVAYGWETWLPYKALQLGYEVKNYTDIRYEHLRPFHPRNVSGWGRAMFSLGFPWYFVFLRFAINLVWTTRGTQSRTSAATMLAGYLSARLNPKSLNEMLIDDPALKAFVRHVSTARLSKLI